MRDAEATLDEALDCLEAQRGVSLQVVAVDDGSTDGSLDILRRRARTWPELQVMAAPAEGVPAALERGRAVATAPWIGRMDADDLCPPHRFEALLARAIETRSPVDVLGSRLEGFGHVSQAMAAYLRWQNGLVHHDEIVRNRFVESPLAHATAVIRATTLDDVGGWDPAATWSEDVDLWCRLAAAGARFGKLDEVLYRWRLHDRQATRVDPRCASGAMRACKIHYLSQGPLRHRRVSVWSVGQTLRTWCEELEEAGCDVRGEIVKPRTVAMVPIPIPAPGEVILAVYGAAATRERVLQLYRGPPADLWFAA